MNENEEAKKITTKLNIIAFIIIALIFIIVFKPFSSSDSSTSSSSSNTSTPSKIELMSYAQTVLEKNVYNASYSRNSEDYTFIETGLRYKIEGIVKTSNGNEKFYMVISFTDSTYTKYDLISLQVGNKRIV